MASNHPWKEDAQETYLAFFSKIYKGSFSGSEDKNFKIVAAHQGKFLPLSTWEGATRCSKITLQNMSTDIEFDFSSKVFGGVLGQLILNKFKGGEVAYRHIVPFCFHLAPAFAGDLGIHEYLVNGEGLKEELSFVGNNDVNLTPLEIIAENCSGKWTVKGMDKERDIFTQTNSPNLVITYCPDAQDQKEEEGENTNSNKRKREDDGAKSQDDEPNAKRQKIKREDDGPNSQDDEPNAKRQQ